MLRLWKNLNFDIINLKIVEKLLLIYSKDTKTTNTTSSREKIKQPTNLSPSS